MTAAPAKFIFGASFLVWSHEAKNAKADDEARLAAQAEALERAKEDAAAAKFQMETQEKDRILADKEAKAKADE